MFYPTEAVSLCYMMICSPGKQYRLQRPLWVNISIIATWCFTAAFSAAPLYWYNMQYNEGECSVEDMWHPGYKMLYLVQFFFTATFFGIIVLFVLCGVHRLRGKLELYNRRRKQKRLTSEVRKKYYMYQSVAVCVAAGLLLGMTVPYHASALVHLILGYKIIPDLFITISYYLCIAHVAVPPIIYGCYLRKASDCYIQVIQVK